MAVTNASFFHIDYAEFISFCLTFWCQPQLLAATKFIAHSVNQQVAHEIIALELLTVLLEKPTDDSVEVFPNRPAVCVSLYTFH